MPATSPTSPRTPDAPPVPVFGVNEMRLNARLWIITVGVVLAVWTAVPWVWKKLEPLDAGRDYRIPYALSRDYWLYARRLEQARDPQTVFLVGDSVVWGEYVLPDGTLSHFLDRESGATNRFLNAGVNGMFPLALEGLVDHYGRSIGKRKVLLPCNLLWMTSPKADLSTPKEESFNHSRLVPQFSPRIPCYRAEASERLGAIVERQSGFLQWVGHLENVYFGQKSIPSWTLADDGGDPATYPNLNRCPFGQITLKIPSPFGPDADRGPASGRHHAWNQKSARPVEFEWVQAEASLQWQAFQRTVKTLRGRGADVLVMLGPFNESMLAPDDKAVYLKLHSAIAAWLKSEGIPHIIPEPLPSELYADASHPLTDGYALLAQRLWADTTFQQWWKQ
ncbi:MAG: SGNH/GDSL hydrolase family protein [Verrucomicrobiales bacterium]|nr:SGNH/GDSL hydrolase family protein [Verrucomicrobiales bacterium]